jgi:tRNA(Ile)-lysidine synthase
MSRISESNLIRVERIIPDTPFYLGVSGGVDSMAALDFLSVNRKVSIAFFDHGTETSKEAKEFLLKYSSDKEITILIGNKTRDITKKESLEEYWRNIRYEWFHSLDKKVATCHHLDDCIETWIWSCLHGQGKIIPQNNRNVFRPFRLTSKQAFVNWCIRKNVPWVEDKSNSDMAFMRNLIRNKIVPEALKVNPGLHKVIFKKIMNRE